MLLPPDTYIHATMTRWAKYLTVLTIVIALLVLCGWQFNIEFLRGWGQWRTYTNPLSAVSVLLSAIALLPYSRRKRAGHIPTISSVAVGIVLAIFLIDVSGKLIGMDAGIDLVLFRNRLMALPNLYRINISTSICFVLVALAIIFLPVTSSSRWKISHLLVLPVLLVSIFCMIAYLFQGESFRDFMRFIPMGLPTAVSFFILSACLLFLTPGEGFMEDISSSLSGSTTARLLIPAAIIVPALLGFLRLWGFRRGYYDNEFGVALLTVSTIFIFFAIIWFNTVVLNRRDMLKLEADRALHDSEAQVRAIFANAPDAIVVLDQHCHILSWNPQAEFLFGWKASEVDGKSLGDMIIPEKDRSYFETAWQRFLSSAGQNASGSQSLERLACRKDNTRIDISVSLAPLNTALGQHFIGFIRDITEAKKTELKLLSFNEELATQVMLKTKEVTDLFERVTDGFIALDKEFRYIYMNKRAGEMVHKDPISVIGKNVWEVFPEAVGTATYQTFHKAMKEQRYMVNTDHFEPLGIWQENHIYPSPNGLSVFIRDISRHKNDEYRITQAQNLADKLIDSLPGVFYFYDESGKFLKWNRQFEEVTGYTSAEIAEMHPLQFFNSKDHPYMISRIQDVFNTGEGDAEANFVTRSGTQIPYHFRATRIDYQGKACLLGTGLDVTDRKKAEAAILASEQKYKLLFESNPMPMWMVKLPEYKLMDVNYTALRKYRYTKAEFLNMGTADLMTEDERKRADFKVNTEFRGEYHAGIWKHKDKQGKLIYADIVTHDIYYQNVPVRLVLSNDVTEQYLAKERLEQSYESIRELSEYLQNIREEERLHISREIHDELGQQLTVLKMDVSWLNKKIDTDGPVKQKLTELLGLIDVTVKTVRRIASELRPTLLDDLGIQAAMEWHLEEFHKRSGIETSFDPPDNEIEVPDNLKIGLFRIFQESLTNVARHSGARNVDVTLKQEANNVILIVKDNGHGFDEEKTRKKTLGLLGMKERSSVMGGDYSISSRPGEGTTVKVIVPIPVEKIKSQI